MNIPLSAISFITAVLVFLGWNAFLIVWLSRKKPPKSAEQKRDKAAGFGIILQGVGFALIWTVRRSIYTSIVPVPVVLNLIIGAMAVGLMAGSIWLTVWAVQTLGKQWSLAARVVREHELVIEGPYKIMRHPIYASMLGMLLATGLVVSRWEALLAALVFYMIGTMIRIRAEEKLLKEKFGQVYEEYAKEVPALFPGISKTRKTHL